MCGASSDSRNLSIKKIFIRKERDNLDATTKKHVDKCINIIKEATYGKGDDAWRVLTVRKEISSIIGSSSMPRLKEVQEGIKNHPNIIYRLNKSYVGRKPLEYRYVSEEEKAQYDYQYPSFNFVNEFMMEYIKEQLGEDISIQTLMSVCRFVDALSCRKANSQWAKIDIDDFSKTVCQSPEDIQNVFRYMIENKILLQLGEDPIYRVTASDEAYEEALKEMEEPDKIREFISISLVKVKNKRLLVKKFHCSDNDEEEVFSIKQVNNMLGALVAKRLDDYNSMEKRVAQLEQENETLRMNAIGLRENTDMSVNTFELMQKKYIEYSTLAEKQKKELEIFEKFEKKILKKINKIKENADIMQKRIEKIIDDYTFLDKSQLTDPRIVNRVKTDIDHAVQKMMQELSEL